MIKEFDLYETTDGHFSPKLKNELSESSDLPTKPHIPDHFMISPKKSLYKMISDEFDFQKVS